jgi:regulator of protease activity HflC (stomatin/prohibitin superfamily)
MGAQPPSQPFPPGQHCGEDHGKVLIRLDVLTENRNADVASNDRAHGAIFERLNRHTEADGHPVELSRLKFLEENQMRFAVTMTENFDRLADSTTKASGTAEKAAKTAQTAVEAVAAIHKAEREEDQTAADDRKKAERKQARADRWWLGLIAAVAIILSSLLNGHGAGFVGVVHTIAGK